MVCNVIAYNITGEMDRKERRNTVNGEGMVRFRSWLKANAVERAVRGFLPSFVDGDASKLRVVVDDSLQPRTDGKTVWVSLLSPAVEDGYTSGDWMLLLRAAAAHETQHVNSSNFSDIRTIMDWYGAYLFDNYGFDRRVGQGIAKQALNIVEDGRIERIAVRRRPGMFVPFYMMNYIIREANTIRPGPKTPEAIVGAFWSNVLSYAKTGLYAPGIEEYQGTEMEQVFLSIQPLIDQGIRAYSSEDCRKTVEELLREVSPFLAKLIQQSPSMQSPQGGGSGDDDNEYTSDSESEYNESDDNESEENDPSNSSDGQQKQQGGDSSDSEDSPGGSPQQGSKKSKKRSSGGDSQQDSKELRSASATDGQDSKDGKPVGFANAKKMQKLPDEEAAEAARMAEASLDSANRKRDAEQNQTEEDALDKNTLTKIRQCYAGRTPPFVEVFEDIHGTEPIPADLKTEALTLRRSISRIINDRSREYRGLRRGNLDTRALWKTGVGNSDIFMKKGCPEQFSSAFYLLIDNSGSMDASADGTKLTKYQAARRAAAVIEEAVKGLIPCKIGLFQAMIFSQSGSKTSCIKTFDDKRSVNNCWNSLRQITPDGYNADSINIRVAAEQLARRREKKKVLIILSDGTPSAYSSAESAIQEVKKAVSDARKKGITVISIMFGEESFLAAYEDKYRQMYEKNIIACRPRDISQRLSALFGQLMK